MNVRVNLLKPEEFRRQGMVSTQFAVRVALAGAGALLLLLSLISVVNHRVVMHNLKLSQEIWEEMKPRYERVKEMQSFLATKGQVWSDLTAWNTSRIDWHPHLASLQQAVPPSVQLTKLSIRSQFVMLPDTENAKNELGLPARQFFMTIDGKIGGDLADEVVVQFVRDLRAGSSLKDVLESAKLQALQRDAGSSGERTFGVEGTCTARKM